MTAACAPHLVPAADRLSVVKGLEADTLLRMSEVVAQASGVPPVRVAALSGPNLAAEVARNLPTSAVVASPDLDLARRIVDRLARRRFRLYVNEDILGVELAGALKNVVAIAAGIVDGLGFGDNGKAGLVTRGLVEMMRLGKVAGANALTFTGLAGIGDLITTAGSRLSRNHRLGEKIAKGRSWAEIEATMPGTAEGAYTVKAALALADRWAWTCPSRARFERACSRARACSAASSTCSRASRRTSSPMRAPGWPGSAARADVGRRQRSLQAHVAWLVGVTELDVEPAHALVRTVVVGLEASPARPAQPARRARS